ncbi:uncharacterized protein LOC120645247 isoform X1 [Panicum virgatum]|uniref:Uncharacterized protein n=1 Tax=Panicum virgatum TaxID=38727 RepID=A0A8T0PQ77_PANVG|nr:uncharacterized protein LOC120645242 isoform X1 [Panicum virgatum]XP_039777990.1 uncharacterized protein LOC120645247 isoform X1 [Panicum virgatum]KAG2564093.1 hypothetical protein PVAP13_8KG252011 [Panicum virgatum]KAG2564103.1 hypothetical protein PVAP13_8KG383500 [Panicum virgatum]
MASAAILRSAARSLRLLQPLEQSGCLLGRRAIVGDLSPSTRLLSSSVPTERSRSTIEQKSLTNKKTEDIYQRISTKFDKISAGLDEQSRLLKQIEVQMEENNKRRGAIDLTPWVVSIPVSFLLVALYNYVQS